MLSSNKKLPSSLNNSTTWNPAESLKSLGDSLNKMATRPTSTSNRPLNSKLRLLILKKMPTEIPEHIIIECLADTIMNDVMTPNTVFRCTFCEALDSPCSTIEEEAKLFLQLNGIDVGSSIFDAAIFLILERKADELKSKTDAMNKCNKKVIVEFAENTIRTVPMNAGNKSYNPRSLLKRKHI